MSMLLTFILILLFYIHFVSNFGDCNIVQFGGSHDYLKRYDTALNVMCICGLSLPICNMGDDDTTTTNNNDGYHHRVVVRITTR